MRPTADFALKGIQENLLQVIAPRVTDAEALRQIQSMANVVGRLADEWSDEPRKQRAANETVAELLRRAAEVVETGGERADLALETRKAIEAAPADDGTMQGVYARQDALNAALVRVLEALEQMNARGSSEDASRLRTDIYRHLKTMAY